jgi:peptidoglycan/LPS O-acetylase OafA/YrhL
MTVQQATPPHSKSQKVMTVEFWRFFFTVIVCLYHLEIYLSFGGQSLFPSGSSAVEFFFVIAGFTMAMSAKRSLAGRTESMTVREAQIKALEFVKSKLKAIYPILIVVMLLWFAVPTFMPQTVSKLQLAMNTEWEWLFLVGTPFGTLQGSAPLIPLWFLTVLIVVGYIYTYFINRHYDFVKFAAPALGIFFYIYFALNAEKILDFYIPMGFLNAGFVRGFAEMSFGISIFYLYEYISQKKLGIIWKILLTLLELYAIYRYFALTVHAALGPDNYRRMVYILIIVLLSFLNVDFISKGLSKLGPLWKRAGTLSLTMYMCHIPVVSVYLWLLGTVKMNLMMHPSSSGFAKAVSNFLKDTGGRNGFKQIPMSWKDMLIFLVMVIIAAIIITLLIAAVKKFIAKPLYARYKAKQAEQEMAAVNG